MSWLDFSPCQFSFQSDNEAKCFTCKNWLVGERKKSRVVSEIAFNTWRPVWSPEVMKSVLEKLNLLDWQISQTRRMIGRCTKWRVEGAKRGEVVVEEVGCPSTWM